MSIATLIILIEQRSEQFANVLGAFQNKEITPKEILEFILEFLTKLDNLPEKN